MILGALLLALLQPAPRPVVVASKPFGESFVLAEMFATGKTAEEVIKDKGFEQVSDAGAIEKIVDEVIAANQANVEAYRGGNEKLFGFFVGQVMKASQGKANPKVVNDILKQKL
jgi:aspartyl-tRNA(Asn)/glutamyl-tRNA(Gln) amidotransferase subunit B